MNVFLPLPLPLTPRQWLYLAGTQCLVAGVVDGGANFGIAYAMYHAQADVRMWVFSKNTIAGDLGVTPLIQCAMSMIITSTLVHTDIHHSAVKPLAFVYPHISHLPEPTIFVPFLRTPSTFPPPEKTSNPSFSTEENHRSTFATFCRALVRFIFEGTENNMILDWHGPGVFLKRLVWTAVQGLGIGVVFGLPLWCLAIVILGPIYGNGNMGNKWAPEAIKLVYGFILGILTNPLIAILALGSQAEHHLVVVEQPNDIEKQGQTEQTTIPSSPGDGSLVLPSTPGSRRRPSLVANESGMVAPPLMPGSSPILTRPRALTSASETASVYSLGGTGGRAQRPRAASCASELSTATGLTAMPAESPIPTRAIPVALRSDYGVPSSPSLSTRGRAPGPAGVMRLVNQGLEAPRESMEGRESEDVFGSKPLGSSV